MVVSSCVTLKENLGDVLQAAITTVKRQLVKIDMSLRIFIGLAYNVLRLAAGGDIEFRLPEPLLNL